MISLNWKCFFKAELAESGDFFLWKDNFSSYFNGISMEMNIEMKNALDFW